MLPSAPHVDVVTGVPVRNLTCESLPSIQRGLPVIAHPLPLCAQPIEDVGDRSSPTRMTHIASVWDKCKPHLDSIRSSLRPWSEFAVLAKPQGDAMKRLQVNLRYYRSNYAVGWLSLSIVTVAVSPSSIIAVAILIMIWMKFIEREEDMEWRVSIGGYELGRSQRWAILQIFSCLVLLFTVGKHFLHAALTAGFFSMAHAVLRPSPDALVDAMDSIENGEDDAPALVLEPVVH